ncbi:hypothetical protein B0H14DRAFT_3149715 [Mycena olivaceomarginata]|nr:hypothetical protein B0H14DRAFT_3149715 [Mycena olivaceomarginata]
MAIFLPSNVVLMTTPQASKGWAPVTSSVLCQPVLHRTRCRSQLLFYCLTLSYDLPKRPQTLPNVYIGHRDIRADCERPMFYVGLYAAVGMFGVVLQLASAALQYTGALKASRIPFDGVFLAKTGFDFEHAPLLRSRLFITVVTYKPLSGFTTRNLKADHEFSLRGP